MRRRTFDLIASSVGVLLAVLLLVASASVSVTRVSGTPGAATGRWCCCPRLWTMSAYRRQGIGTAMVRRLMARAPGQHIGLQTEEAEAFYTSLGYRHQPVFMSAIVGEWLVNEANQP